MRLLAFLFIFATSCGRADFTWPALIRIAPNTSPHESYLAINSIKDLNTFMGFEVTKFALDAETVTAYTVVVNFSPTNNKGKAGLAAVYGDICFITIYPVAVNLNLVKATMWHEIGHCAGLLHVEQSGEIMSTAVTEFPHYSQDKLLFFKNQLKSILKR